jgi:diguanylate cyclase (GGDEF)-like protein
MDHEIALDKIALGMNFIEKLYDYIRVVDVLNKKVNYLLKPQTYKIIGRDKTCYNFWKKGTSCENCISARAYSQNRTIFKIEYTDNYVYLVTAVPVVFNDNKIVIEGLRDITNEGIINIQDLEIGEIQKLVNRNNQLIVRDALTRIYNEQFIYEKLPYDILKSQKENRSLALLFLRINNFQAINDLYDYKAGDYIIREFSKLIKYYCKKNSDWVARFSRVEFVVVIFDLNEKRTYEISKRINDKINKLKFKYEGKIIKIELGIGCHIIHGESITVDEFIEKASKNFYPINTQVKDRGLERTFEGLLHKFLFTEREREVSLLLLKGLSNNEISQKLFISISTVKKHITNILDKVKAKSRSEFIAKYANF